MFKLSPSTSTSFTYVLHYSIFSLLIIIFFSVRDLESGQYVSSLIDQDEGRYLTLCAGSNVVIAGGHLLKVWIHKERR